MSGDLYTSLDDMAAWARGRMQRVPDFVIGDPALLRRWWVIPRNEHQNVYLHELLRVGLAGLFRAGLRCDLATMAHIAVGNAPCQHEKSLASPQPLISQTGLRI